MKMRNKKKNCLDLYYMPKYHHFLNANFIKTDCLYDPY